MTHSYTSKPQSYYWDDDTQTPEPLVYEQSGEPMPIGVLDADGNMIYRVKDPMRIGFIIN